MQGAGRQPGYIPPMAEGIRRGRRGDGAGIQVAEGGERPFEATGSRLVVGQPGVEGVGGGKMVGPARKREAVGHLQRALEMSERRACKVVGQPRSTQRYAIDPDDEEVRLRMELREISRLRPRAGYRMAARCLRRGGWRINDKRVQRLWLEEGLKVTQKGRKRLRLGTTAQGSQRLRASQPNEVSSYYFVQDQTRDGRLLKHSPRATARVSHPSTLMRTSR